MAPPGPLALALAVAVTAAALSLGAEAAAAPVSKIRLCTLLFGGVDDLGYTFSFNVARLKIHENIEAMFPNSTVESQAVQNVFFMTPVERRQVLANFVADGCNVVSSNDRFLLHDGDFSTVSRLYPNVSFFTPPVSVSQLQSSEFPNIVFFNQNPRQAYYVKGGAAARQARTCVGIMAAFEYPGTPLEAVNGAVRGIRDEHPTIPIHVVTMNSWYWPDAETDVARLFMRMGCEVVMRYSDPRAADLTIATEAPGPGYFSVGPHSDLQLYVGDTVLVASYAAWDVGLTPLIAHALRDGRPSHAGIPYIFGRGVVLTTPLSPRSSGAARAALRRAEARLAANSDVLCGPMALRNGTTVATTNPSGCLNLTQPTELFLGAPFTTFHGTFRHRSECAAGTFATYDTAAPRIALTCTPCPRNAFSTQAGATECSPCPNGTEARELGSTACTAVPVFVDDRSSASLAPWAVGTIVAVAALGSAAVAVLVVVCGRRDPLAHCPLDESAMFTVAFVQLVQESALHDACTAESVAAAMDKVAASVRAAARSARCYPQRVNDGTFLVAAKDPARALRCAARLSNELNKAVKWRHVLEPKPAPAALGGLAASTRSSGRGSGGRAAVSPHSSAQPQSRWRVAMSRFAVPDDLQTQSSRLPEDKTVPDVRVAVGVATGFGTIDHDDEVHSVTFRGAVVAAAAAATDAAVGGQIAVTEAVADVLAETDHEAAPPYSSGSGTETDAHAPAKRLSQTNTATSSAPSAAARFTLYCDVDMSALRGSAAASLNASALGQDCPVLTLLTYYPEPTVYDMTRGTLARIEQGAQRLTSKQRRTSDERAGGGGVASALSTAAIGVGVRRVAVAVIEIPLLALAGASEAPATLVRDVVAQLQLAADIAAAHRGQLHDVVGSRIVISVNGVGAAAVAMPAARAAQIAIELATALSADSSSPPRGSNRESAVTVISAGVAVGTTASGTAAGRGVIAGSLFSQAALAQAMAAALGVPVLAVDACEEDLVTRFRCATTDAVAVPAPLSPDGGRVSRVLAVDELHPADVAEGSANMPEPPRVGHDWLYAGAAELSGGAAAIEAAWQRMVASDGANGAREVAIAALASSSSAGGPTVPLEAERLAALVAAPSIREYAARRAAAAALAVAGLGSVSWLTAQPAERQRAETHQPPSVSDDAAAASMPQAPVEDEAGAPAVAT